MTQLTQTPQFQIDKLKIFLKTTQQPNERDRARAILKLIAGRKRKEVANFFDIHIKTLDKWQGTFKEQGIDGLRTESQIGNNYKLSQAKSEISYHNLFKFCGFSYHKPNKVNKRQNPHMRQRFEDVLKKSSNGAIEKIVWSW